MKLTDEDRCFLAGFAAAICSLQAMPLSIAMTQMHSLVDGYEKEISGENNTPMTRGLVQDVLNFREWRKCNAELQARKMAGTV